MCPLWTFDGSPGAPSAQSTTWSEMSEPLPIDAHFLATVSALPESEPRDPSLPLRDTTGLTATRALDLLASHLGSRHLALAARRLGAAGIGYYTIGSSGH